MLLRASLTVSAEDIYAPMAAVAHPNYHFHSRWVILLLLCHIPSSFTLPSSHYVSLATQSVLIVGGRPALARVAIVVSTGLLSITSCLPINDLWL